MFWDKKPKNPDPIVLRFDPRPDITAYELALIIKNTWPELQHCYFDPTKFIALDESLKRHWA